MAASVFGCQMPLVSFSVAEAGANLRKRRSLWPNAHGLGGRLGGVAQVEQTPGFVFEPGEPVFTVGSCFARNIEARLAAVGMDVVTLRSPLSDEHAKDNDVLNKYTPHAILNEFRWTLDPDAAFPEDGFLKTSDGLWHDPHAAPFLPPAEPERVQERRRAMTAVFEELSRCRVVILTLGLVESWLDLTTGLYLNGAPPPQILREQPDRFRLDILSPADVEAVMEEIVGLLKRHGHPQFRMLATVSPVPLKATYADTDVLIANTYSKSALRVAIEATARRHPEIDYFPSYEIVSLSERSLAFQGDNRHVNSEVVGGIVDQVVRLYLPTAEREAAPASPMDLKDDMVRARKALTLGEFEKAAKLLVRLSRDKGWKAAGYREFQFRKDLGLALLRTGKPVAAQTELRRAVEVNEGSAEAAYLLGQALEALGRLAEAESFFQRAAELDPVKLRYSRKYARHLVQKGESAEAERVLYAFVQRDPENEEAVRLLAALRAETPDDEPAQVVKPPSVAAGAVDWARSLMRRVRP